jgi:hypothetical protein
MTGECKCLITGASIPQNDFDQAEGCFGFLEDRWSLSKIGNTSVFYDLALDHAFQAVFVMNPPCITPAMADSPDLQTCEFWRRRLRMNESLSFLKGSIPLTFHGLHRDSHKVVRIRLLTCHNRFH